MSKVVVLQSNYLPWKGYFDLIHDADIFIFYDVVKYTKNDWRNRNRIYTKNGLQWLTIPMEGEAVKHPIREVEIKDQKWQALHYKTLFLAYKRAPYFKQLEPILEDVYQKRQWQYLSVLNRYLIEKIATLLGIKTQFMDAADFKLEGDRVTRLVHLLSQVKATEYISGPAAKDYLAGSERLFEEKNIQLTYKDYSGYPEYPQLRKPFQQAVSIVDMLANVPLDEIQDYIWGWRKS